MKTLNYKFNDIQIKYDISALAAPEKILFLDIETTGFSPRSAYVYLIGACYLKNGSWHGIQWFAEGEQEEERIIKSFFQFGEGFDTLVHFNGNQFDLPFLLGRIKHLNLDYSFESFTGVDLYRRIVPYKHFLRLENCKQKTLETFLGLNREDICSGGEMAAAYKEYQNDPFAELLDTILLHNRDDLRGMLEILPILAYSDIFNLSVSVQKVQANHYKDYRGKKGQELMITLRLPGPVPVQLSVNSSDCYFRCEGTEGILRVPIYEEELKYFYSDYQNYYYLPGEDMAIHKSVASFVDKSHRVKASASNCYTRKLSAYLPQWDCIFTPFFKREYDSSLLFFELTDELKTNRGVFLQYADHLLSMLAVNIKQKKQD